MALNRNMWLLFSTGGAGAAGAIAWAAGLFTPAPPPNVPPQQPAGVVSTAEASKPVVQEASKAEAPQQAAAPTPPPAVKPVAVVTPSFDLVRVEPDGSIVIAGHAAPNSSVDAVIGSKVIGSTKAGPEGDLAIVLDQPLKPGDYQIVLRSTATDSVVATSVETAIVSVPETPEGQVLALVEQPGKPSELITVPKPEAAEVAAPTPQPETAPSGASASPAETPGAQQASVPTAEEPRAAVGSKLKVEAVEIEGRKVFVAGVADPGQLVRAYANDILLGETKAGPNGRFLIETERDLAVGDYIVRIDAIAADGAKVLARSAVPFEREVGENVAAVASGDEDAASQDKVPASVPAPASGASVPVAPATPAPVTTPDGDDQKAENLARNLVGGQSAAPEVQPEAAPTLEPKLKGVDAAVIIRKGDSLWRISRRVYGQGMRYSTIYLANQEQIQNPDKIWPGQVFRIPGKTGQGEKADMSRLGEQAVPSSE